MTPQYAGLRTLQLEHAAAGFTVLGFPCNQFGAQEPGTDAEILEFATSKYDANFPMFSKIDVNGDGAAPLYQLLKSAAPAPDGSEDIPWNFAKFVVGRDGQVLARISPTVTPADVGITSYL
ncbi:MAG: glutathione peroxidase [Myxococcota bacterium]